MKNAAQKTESCYQKAKKLISKCQKLPITGISGEWVGMDFAQKNKPGWLFNKLLVVKVAAKLLIIPPDIYEVHGHTG